MIWKRCCTLQDSCREQLRLGGSLIKLLVPIMLLLSPGRNFCRDFRAQHINEGMMELKHEEFRSLRMGSMTVAEYHDTFEQLACYAPNDVREDVNKQCLFMKGLYYELRLQLAGNTYPTFHALVNRAIVLDNMRKGQDKKRRMLAKGSGSNNRQCFG
jgi:hypothetical protein